MKSVGSLQLAGTFLERLMQSLEEAARHQPGEVAPPAAVLWPDADGQWKPLLPTLLTRMPNLFVLGQYDPQNRAGPAIWLKCIIAGTLETLRVPDGTVPVIYMPGVTRQTLRAGEECPQLLRPLVELQYRGIVWTQRNGKDWTVEAFMVSDEGLGLDVARDTRTRQSMLGALPVVAETPLPYLSGRRLEAEDFDRLLVGDYQRNLLVWMNDPQGTRANWDKAEWNAFRSRCRDEYDFDPQTDGETIAGEKLGLRETDAWRALWRRFCEAPGLYPGIETLLIRSKPTGKLIFDKETWPDENNQAESQLRQVLLELEELAPAEVQRRVTELEREHGIRRQWVWARIGRSPLALALEHLAILAQHCASMLGGDTPDEIARLYAEGGYLADDAALKALASVNSSVDSRAVQVTVRAIYLPWLEESTRHFQSVVASHPLPVRNGQPNVEAKPGECILFADGLRFDLAQRLVALLEARGLKVTQQRRWSALPTVTATAKPAVSPVANLITGRQIPEDFTPEVAATGQTLRPDRFRKLLEENGYRYIPAAETGDPGNPHTRGWTEFGQIDERGHHLQIDLATQIDSEINRLCERIVELLDAGWRAIRVVTDHGWLLMPGGLPRHDLPSYLVANRWARCAVIKGESRVEVPKAPWYWNPSHEFAAAPGIACFESGYQYAHGGLSLQECLVTDLQITPPEDQAVTVHITGIQWFGLRCRVNVEPAETTLQVDLRTKANLPESSILASPKQIDREGRASVVVPDEDLKGTAVIVVVINSSGQVVARRPTTVGGE